MSELDSLSASSESQETTSETTAARRTRVDGMSDKTKDGSLLLVLESLKGPPTTAPATREALHSSAARSANGSDGNVNAHDEDDDDDHEDDDDDDGDDAGEGEGILFTAAAAAPLTAPTTILSTAELSSIAQSAAASTPTSSPPLLLSSFSSLSANSMSNSNNNFIEVEDDGHGDEIVDPRVKGALEALNYATDEINRLEKEIDSVKKALRELGADAEKQSAALAAKLGKCVEKTKAYYELRAQAMEAQKLAMEAAKKFERAANEHEAAKEKIAKAEKNVLTSDKQIDPVWQDMMNHAMRKIAEAEKAKSLAFDEHQATTITAAALSKQLDFAGKDIKNKIQKAKPFYDLKIEFEEQRSKLNAKLTFLNEELALAKKHVSYSLSNLNDISEEIHELRKRKSERNSPVPPGRTASMSSP